MLLKNTQLFPFEATSGHTYVFFMEITLHANQKEYVILQILEFNLWQNKTDWTDGWKTE